MSRLGLITGASIIDFSQLPEVKELSTEQADRYARMAEGVAGRYADYDATKEHYREEMSDAVCLIAEQLVVRLSQVPRRIDALALESEVQGPHSYRRVIGRIDEIIPALAREILDFFAVTPPKHGVLYTKVFASPHLTDSASDDRATRYEEEMNEAFVEFDENLK